MGNYPTNPAFQTLENATRFYFVRHGESEANRRNIIQGRLDPGLSRAGRAHAEAAGRWFSQQDVDAVFTSPLLRAVATAKAIANATGLQEPVILPSLVELDTGVFSGKSLKTIQAQYPEIWREFRRRSWEVVPRAERIASLQSRAFAAWSHLLEHARAGHRRIVSVTHAGTLQWLIRASMGPFDHAWMPVFKADNCGVFALRVEPVAATSTHPASYFAEWELLNYVSYHE
jgi:broad specificity phosphatase PhoE